MTTNVYCRPQGFLTSDSRWTFESEFGWLYVDDTGFDKVDVLKDVNAGFLFAGNSAVIGEWRQWINSNPTSVSDAPKKEHICVCIVNLRSGAYREWHGFPLENAWFAGTGFTYALLCYGSNKDARRAIESAKQMDPFSGGATLYYERNTGANNLNRYMRHIGVADIASAAIKRGTVMYREQGNQRIPVQDAANSDPRVEQFCQEIAQCKVSASAPCVGTQRAWTKEESDSLDDALRDIFQIP